MTNQSAFAQAKKVIAGGVDSPVRAFGSVGGEPPFIQKAKNEFLYDVEGRRYIDYVLSWGPMIFGHADKDVLKAVCKSAKHGLSFGAPCVLETQLASLVLEKFPHLDKIRFVNSGTEATMSAIRLARGFSKKDGILKFAGCYHGHSDSLLVKAGSGATTFGNSDSLGVPQDFAKHTHIAIYNDLESVKKCLDSGEIGCVIIEPIAGNMGLVPAETIFLQGLRKLCDKYGAVLIFDEVMSGFRASQTGSFGLNGIKADIVTFGKVIGGGMPCAAYAARDEIMSLISPLGGVYQAGTLSGNPVAMAAGIATLSKINQIPKLYDKLSQKTAFLTGVLKDCAAKKGVAIQVQSRGSMWGFFFNQKSVKNYEDALRSDTQMFARFHKAMLANGIYLPPSQFETLFVCKKHSQKSLEKTAEMIEKSFKQI